MLTRGYRVYVRREQLGQVELDEFSEQVRCRTYPQLTRGAIEDHAMGRNQSANGPPIPEW